MNPTPSIWLLSAYRSDSHASWSDWLLRRFGDIDWTRLELPGRHFRWRIRGNPISWLDSIPASRPDRILATSMVDLATLKGLHPQLAGVATSYYFHENQFAYPVSERQRGSAEPQMVQLYGALAADELLFNSEYNRDSFLAGVDALLSRLPDHVPAGIAGRLGARSTVLPVPVEPVIAGADDKRTKDPRLIVWNHRWEYDKAPDIFADAIEKLAADGVEFRLALLGKRHAVTPDALARIEHCCAQRIIANEKVDSSRYAELLADASIVVSTAIHEFQGLSVIEAVSAGAVPLVPDDLCYREQYADDYRYPAGDSAALAARLARFLVEPPPVPDVSAFYTASLEQRWHDVLMR